MKAIKIDSNGLFIEGVIVAEGFKSTIDIIVEECPDGFYRPKWDGAAWVEGRTQAEIDAIKNTVVPKTPLEIVQENQKNIQDALDFLMMGGI